MLELTIELICMSRGLKLEVKAQKCSKTYIAKYFESLSSASTSSIVSIIVTVRCILSRWGARRIRVTAT